MKRRVAYFLLCVCFCFYTLSLSSSAVEYDPYTGEEMIFDPVDGSYYVPYKPLEYDPIMPLIATEPYYTDFDINKLPWVEMPTYVQEILYGTPQGNSNDISYSGTYKVPFVLAIVSSSQVHLVAGWNLSIGTYFRTATQVTNKDPVAIYISSIKSSAYIYNNAVCYHAYYSTSDYSLKTDWSVVEPVSVGDRIVRYVGITWPQPSTPRDYYCYGFNGFGPGKVMMAMRIYEDPDAGENQYRFVGDPVSGFASGKFVLYQDDIWSNYFGSFTPPTAEQQQVETSKGIWETLKSVLTYVKNLPSNIANSIKGFFTTLGDRISTFFDNLANKIKDFFLPSDGFFDTYVAEFQEYFKDRFGLLYELPDAVVGILQQFIDYSPAEEGYSITFPEVVLPVLDNGEWYDKVIIEETDITFEFLEQGAFKTLYSMYRSVIWMIFIFALINLIIRKSERVFGGSG